MRRRCPGLKHATEASGSQVFTVRSGEREGASASAGVLTDGRGREPERLVEGIRGDEEQSARPEGSVNAWER